EDEQVDFGFPRRCGRGCECVGVADGDEEVGWPADAKGGVTRERLRSAHVAVALECCCELIEPGHRSSSRILGPTSTTSPAPMVKMTSPGLARVIAFVAASSKSFA